MQAGRLAALGARRDFHHGLLSRFNADGTMQQLTRGPFSFAWTNAMQSVNAMKDFVDALTRSFDAAADMDW